MASGKPLSEFDLLRSRAKSRTAQQGQVAGEAVRRRFAALGGLSTGAAIKTEGLALKEAQKIGEQRLGDIDIAEAAERQRRKEITTAQDIQKEQFGQQFGLQQEQFQFGKESTMRQLNLAAAELKLNTDIAGFNKEMARWQQGQPTDIFGKLLGPQFSTSRIGGNRDPNSAGAFGSGGLSEIFG